MNLLIIGTSAKAQFTETTNLYLGVGVSIGNYNGGDFNFNYGSQNNWSAQFGIKSISREAREKPSDYFGGVVGLLTRGMSNPVDRITSYQFLGGKMVPLKISNINSRLNLLTGPTINDFQKSINFQRNNTTGGVLIGTYTFEKEKSSGFGWMVKPTMEVKFGKVIGLSLNPYLLFNSYDFSYGFDFQFLIGILQPSK
jgi:hypothetical protein